jgi:hypothetical protein
MDLAMMVVFGAMLVLRQTTIGRFINHRGVAWLVEVLSTSILIGQHHPDEQTLAGYCRVWVWSWLVHHRSVESADEKALQLVSHSFLTVEYIYFFIFA